MKEWINDNTQRQLLFDELFLEKSQGITLRMIPPVQKPQPVIVADQPWEKKGIGAYHTVMRDGGKFRMWYDVITTDRQGTERRLVLAKPMEDGSLAMGLFNLAGQPQKLTAGWSELGLDGPQIVRDVWRQKDIGSFDKQFTIDVNPHGVSLIRLRNVGENLAK